MKTQEKRIGGWIILWDEESVSVMHAASGITSSLACVEMHGEVEGEKNGETLTFAVPEKIYNAGLKIEAEVVEVIMD